jgi:hypothetical protein
MTASITMNGSCVCGRIRFTLAGGFGKNVICFCTHCRKMTGSLFMANTFVPKAVGRSFCHRLLESALELDSTSTCSSPSFSSIYTRLIPTPMGGLHVSSTTPSPPGSLTSAHTVTARRTRAGRSSARSAASADPRFSRRMRNSRMD